jgi:hypothetical protein
MISPRFRRLAVLVYAFWAGTFPAASDIWASEQPVEKTLNQMSMGEFIEEPLEQVIAYFSEFHSIPIRIDHRALRARGVDKRVAVTLSASGIRFETMLGLVLKPHGLIWAVRDGSLLITTHEELRTYPETTENASHGRKPLASAMVFGSALRNAGIRRIEEALHEKSTAEFAETPLEEVVAHLSELHDVRLHIDRRALEEIGLDEREPITVSAGGIQLESLLGLILDPHRLTWTVRHESLVITTYEEARKAVSTRAYRIDRLFPKHDVATGAVCANGGMEEYENMGGSGAHPFVSPSYALLLMITTTIEPKSWREDGPGQATLFTVGDRTVLVVRQDYRTHRLIRQLLEDLGRIGREGGQKETVEKPNTPDKRPTGRPTPPAAPSRPTDDPFAAPSANDPFGGAGGAPADDPFASPPRPPADDPFGPPPSKDPFGGKGGARAEDPFG